MPSTETAQREDSALSPGAYRTLVEQAPIMIWRSDLGKGCDYFNERWLEFTGRTLEQERGNGWAEGVHPDDFDRCLEIYVTHFDRREIFEMDYRLRRRDGVYRWIFDRGVPFENEEGAFAGFIGSCIDITERVEAEEALEEALRRELKQLRGLLPICAGCKQIRDESGSWHAIETYIQAHSAADFSHGLCPVCVTDLYGEGDADPKHSVLDVRR